MSQILKDLGGGQVLEMQGCTTDPDAPQVDGLQYLYIKPGEGLFVLQKGGVPSALVMLQGDGEAYVSLAPDYDGTGSFQTIAADLTLDEAAGSSSDPKFLAPVMGNLIGADLSKTKPYLAGLIGAYSVTGVKATTYPSAAVLAIIMDQVTDVDAAVQAVIDGDGGVTKAAAAFGVKSNNSTVGSGFTRGLDLYSAAHDGYGDLAILTDEVRFSKNLANGATITYGALDPSAGGGVARELGSLYIRVSGGASTIWLKTGAAATAWTNIT